MFNNYSHQEIIKHFEIDAGELEKLIKLWVFIYPKDNPTPVTSYSIFVNNTIKEISNATFLQLLKFEVVKTIYWQERYNIKTQTVLTEKPINYLLEIAEKFVEFPETGLGKMFTLKEETPEEPKKRKKRTTKDK